MQQSKFRSFESPICKRRVDIGMRDGIRAPHSKRHCAAPESGRSARASRSEPPSKAEEHRRSPVAQNPRTPRTSRANGLSSVAFALALALLAGEARAQTITNLSIVKNGTNSLDEIQNTNPLFQRASTAVIQNPTTTSFNARYAFLVAADYDGFQLFGATRTESLTSSYTVSFQVTAP